MTILSTKNKGSYLVSIFSFSIFMTFIIKITTVQHWNKAFKLKNVGSTKCSCKVLACKMSRFVFHGRKQLSSRSNLVHCNRFIKSGLKSNTSRTIVLICNKVVVYMVYQHYWSHLFNLCSSFNDKSTLLDPGISVLLANPTQRIVQNTVCQFKQTHNSNNSL